MGAVGTQIAWLALRRKIHPYRVLQGLLALLNRIENFTVGENGDIYQVSAQVSIADRTVALRANQTAVYHPNCALACPAL
jgi:hypothetical protein